LQAVTDPVDRNSWLEGLVRHIHANLDVEQVFQHAEMLVIEIGPIDDGEQSRTAGGL
jgi:hypothetical protein